MSAHWSSRLRGALPVVLLAVVGGAATLWLARRGTPGDYPMDAEPGIDALLRGDIRGFLDEQPLMGSFSLLVRAPFAALGDVFGGGVDDRYRFGIVPCAAAAVALVIHAVTTMRGRGESLVSAAVLSYATLFGTAAVGAVTYGHPEEFLGGALAVAAVIATARGHVAWAGIALGAAIATKFWALVAIGPVFLAADPAVRRRLAVAGAIVALVLIAPLAIGDPGRFASALEQASSTQGTNTGPTNVWWPTHQTVVNRVFDGAEFRDHERYFAGEFAERVSHPLIVLIAVPLTLAAWLARRRRLEDALALLALLFLLRSVLDPLNIDYYHVPLVLALATWEAYARRGLPLATMLTATALWAVYDNIEHELNRGLTFSTYMAWALPMAAYLGVMALRPSRAPSRTP